MSKPSESNDHESSQELVPLNEDDFDQHPTMNDLINERPLKKVKDSYENSEEDQDEEDEEEDEINNTLDETEEEEDDE
ncbi:hypothetical protein FDP41_004234 [Naegleria fowleri]|uniref:Uncharacterized protein n=1 Tax=Naegleria fowleri TaxID=5763 RepID=A0A6A5BVG7_NAEFO|nr:uncharacterized protein FDP41_004234 [Naegleria fowleri]KAF0976939.1 hypothetical protein FDP41_004234 [Naegleria fowleri]